MDPSMARPGNRAPLNDEKRVFKRFFFMAKIALYKSKMPFLSDFLQLTYSNVLLFFQNMFDTAKKLKI
jgi:hypothetical protein